MLISLFNLAAMDEFKRIFQPKWGKLVYVTLIQWNHRYAATYESALLTLKNSVFEPVT